MAHRDERRDGPIGHGAPQAPRTGQGADPLSEIADLGGALERVDALLFAARVDRVLERVHPRPGQGRVDPLARIVPLEASKRYNLDGHTLLLLRRMGVWGHEALG